MNAGQLMDDVSNLASSAVERSAILGKFLTGDPDQRYVEALFCGFWPFVLSFQFAAKEVVQKCLLSANEKLPSLASSQIEFIASRRDALASISDDEHSHMEMWLTASASRGIGYRRLDEWKEIPEVLSLRQRIISASELVDQLIYVLAVELLAGAFSRKVLASQNARFLIGERGLSWFKAHVDHGDFSHASLALDAARFFGAESVTNRYVVEKFDEFATLYLAADRACVTHVECTSPDPA